MKFFKKKKFDLKKAYERLGQFCLVKTSEASSFFGVPMFKIVTYYKGRKISEEPFSEELFEEKERKGIPIKILKSHPEEFEKLPSNRILLGRLELPRLGLIEEEIG